MVPGNSVELLRSAPDTTALPGWLMIQGSFRGLLSYGSRTCAEMRGKVSAAGPLRTPELMGLAPGAAEGLESMLSVGRVEAVGAAAGKRLRAGALLVVPVRLVVCS